MSWAAYLGDTVTGQIGAPIDLPAFSWSVSVSDSSLATTRDKGTGEGEASSITVPWGAVPGDTPEARSSAVAAGRRCVALMWREPGEEGPGRPVVWGAIGARTDRWADTSFSLDSPMALLARRYLVEEGSFGAGPGSTSKGAVAYRGLSYRAIASDVVRRCTEAKPGGALPIDLPWLGERGTRERTYSNFNVQNQSCADILAKIANVAAGPDIQLRPYLADPSHVRLSLEAGSDADVYLGQRTVHRLASFPGGGQLEDLTVEHLGPSSRVYATGSGTEEQMLCHLSEDLSLQEGRDPWPLSEEAWSDPDADSAGLLASHAAARLAAVRRPVAQVKGYVDLADPAVPAPGSIWPGEVVELAVDGHPSLPDGLYRLRLMKMDGDEGTRCRLTFDPFPDPVY